MLVAARRALKLPLGLQASSFMNMRAPLPLGAILRASAVMFLSSISGVCPMAKLSCMRRTSFMSSPVAFIMPS